MPKWYQVFLGLSGLFIVGILIGDGTYNKFFGIMVAVLAFLSLIIGWKFPNKGFSTGIKPVEGEK